MAAAFGWGLVAASSLVIGGALACAFRIPARMIGFIMAFGAGVSYLVAVFISNLPEAVSSTSGLRIAGWTTSRVLRLWVLIALVSAVASLLGYAVFDGASDAVIAFVLTFAAGAVLTMLADTMMPEAYEMPAGVPRSGSRRRSASRWPS